MISPASLSAPKCLIAALVFAWVIAIFLPSAVIALTGLSSLAEGRNLALATFEIADEVSPAAKIGFILAFAPPASVLIRRCDRIAGTWFAMLAAVAAMLLVIALLPVAWSRGFGIGVGGARFDLRLLAIYLGSAALAGLVFAVSHRRCRARSRRRESDSRA